MENVNDNVDIAVSEADLEIVPNYAKYKPQIYLEILTARNLNTIIFINLFIIAAFMLVSIEFGQNFTKLRNVYLYPEPCPQCNSSTAYTSSQEFQNSEFIANLKIDITQNNFTTLVGWSEGSKPGVCQPVSLTVTTTLYACFDSSGCSTINDESDISTNEWNSVYTTEPQNIATNMCRLKRLGKFTYNVLPSLLNTRVYPHILLLRFSIYF